MPTASGASGIVSDDFYETSLTGRTPDPGWIELDKLANLSPYTHIDSQTLEACIGLAVPNQHVIDVPDLNAHCLVQPCTNGDFEIECKIDTRSTTNGTEQGIVVLNGSNPPTDSSNWLVLGNYVSSGNQRSYASQGGSDAIITFTAAPLWLRLNRSGNDWSAYYSTAATYPTFTQIGTTYTYAYTVSYVGIYCASFLAVANAAEFDYFFENSAPISPEDQPTTTRRVMVIT